MVRLTVCMSEREMDGSGCSQSGDDSIGLPSVLRVQPSELRLKQVIWNVKRDGMSGRTVATAVYPKKIQCIFVL
jgi:hypothetical protein